MKCSRTFRLACEYLQRNDFVGFYRLAHPDLERIAKYLLRRWDVPEAVEVEDVVQELASAAWWAMQRWDPTLATLHEYVMFNMTDKAKKELHKQRNAYRRDGSAPGRYEIPESRLRRRASDDGIEHRCSIIDRLSVEPDDEARDAREQGKRLYEQVMGELPSVDAELFEQAFEWGFDFTRAAVKVYRTNPRLSLRARAVSVRDVKARMRRAVEMATRMTAAHDAE